MYAIPELTPYFVNTRKIVRRQINGFYDPLPVAALNPLWAGEKDWLPETGATLAPLTGDVVVEERTFQLRPGGVPAFVAACEAHGVRALAPLSDRTIGAFVSAIGPLHQVALWWWFRDGAERDARLAALVGNSDWRDFLAEIAPALTDQTSLLLQPRPVPEMSPLFA